MFHLSIFSSDAIMAAKFFGRVLLFLTPLLLIITLFEFILFHTGDLLRDKPKETETSQPVYIPHPYFGYVYRPNGRISQMNGVTNTPVYMESNSAGFIDNEFPEEKKEGVCIYGILGGSAAMSWGVEKREERISYRLEELLNTHLRNESCREYRVLNLGIGSHSQYQATQVYLYYKNLLDGVIFFAGFPECAHPAMLTNDEPVQFPVINLYASLKVLAPSSTEITKIRHELERGNSLVSRYPYLMYVPFVKYLFEGKEKRVEELNKKLQNEGHSTTLPIIKGEFKAKLKKAFPALTNPLKLMHSYDYDNPDIPKVLEKILPLVYTDPLLNAYGVSRTTNAHFLSVIEPMIYITGKDPKWKELMFATYHFQTTCVNKLKEEAKKLEACGVKTYNLNEIAVKTYKREFFIDQVHLTKEGTQNVANVLFDLIKKEWHDKK